MAAAKKETRTTSRQGLKQQQRVFFNELLQHFSAVFITTKLDIFRETLGNFQALFVATKQVILRQTFFFPLTLTNCLFVFKGIVRGFLKWGHIKYISKVGLLVALYFAAHR